MEETSRNARPNAIVRVHWRRDNTDTTRRALLVGAASLLFSTGLPALTTTRTRGRTRIDARGYGVVGDGVHDDTAALQAAIDALPASGGTVLVPAGDFVIDPTRRLRLRSRMHLSLDAGTRLLAQPNAAERAYVIEANQVDNVEVSGGRIVGDRRTHLGTRGEWGHGIMLRGATAVTLRDLHISQCWGDGVSIGAAKTDGGAIPSRDVVIARVRCIANRRQGLTIGRSRMVRVSDCEFSETGGTKPGCGIDIEPDPGDVARDILIARCVVRSNAGAGIQLYRRSAEVTVRDCIIEGNRGHGVLAIGAEDCRIRANVLRRNALGAIAVRKGARAIQISLNEMSGNGRELPAGSVASSGGQIAVSSQAQGILLAGDNRVVD